MAVALPRRAVDPLQAGEQELAFGRVGIGVAEHAAQVAQRIDVRRPRGIRLCREECRLNGGQRVPWLCVNFMRRRGGSASGGTAVSGHQSRTRQPQTDPGQQALQDRPPPQHEVLRPARLRAGVEMKQLWFCGHPESLSRV